MKNKIYRYFCKEFLIFFIIILFSLTAIVWTVQAVNYLDLMTEDGHAFNVYFMYSIFGIPKMITKLMPFSFLTAIMLTILKFEDNNELIVLWTSGLNKIRIVNVIFAISIYITILQLITASTISPNSLNTSRSLLKNSDLKLFSSLLKEKKFNDTVKSLTIFVDKKNKDGTINNVFLRDDTKPNESSTTFAKKGYMKQVGSDSFLVLYDGIIQKEKIDGQISFLNFNKSEINLSQYSTKTFSFPKIQENSTYRLFQCSLWLNKNQTEKFKKYINRLIKVEKQECQYPKIEITNELNRRLGMPLYIPLLSLILCFLLSSRKESVKSKYNKYFYFLLGFAVLIFAEISVRYSGKIFYISVLYYLIPIVVTLIIYLILLKLFKYENLRA